MNSLPDLYFSMESSLFLMLEEEVGKQQQK